MLNNTEESRGVIYFVQVKRKKASFKVQLIIIYMKKKFKNLEKAMSELSQIQNLRVKPIYKVSIYKNLNVPKASQRFLI